MVGKSVILSLIITSCCSFSRGQNNINLLAMPMGDSIILRWSPLDVESWEQGLEHGYHIRKAILNKDNVSEFSFYESSDVLVDKLIVWPEAKWKENHHINDEWEMIAAGMVYGDLGMDMGAPTLDPEMLEDRRIAKNNRFAIAFHAANHSVNAAKKLGWMFVDKEVIPGQAYAYSVQPYPLAEKQGNVDIYLVNENKTIPLPIPEIYGAEWGDKEVSLAWNHYNFQESFVSYNVERSGDGGRTWQKRNNAPVVPGFDLKEAVLTTFVDSLEDNITLYQYRISGHSPFGINSNFSEIISGNGQPTLVPIEIDFFPPKENNSDHIQLVWNVNGGHQIKAYNIHRSNDYNGLYTKINSEPIDPAETTFNDPDALGTSFYYIEAIGLNGISHFSLKRMIIKKDVTPPAKPRNLTCALDTLQGGIALQWEKPIEDDFAGHRIFASYRAEDGYQDIVDSLFEESSFLWPVDPKRSGETIYFKVQAQDHRFNRSAYSDYCMVQLGDNVPPHPPLIRKIIDTEKRVVLEWAGSPSYDVSQYEIWRSSDEHNWKIIDVFDGAEKLNVLYDTTDLTVGTEYNYKILAKDRSGNTAESNVKKARVWKSKLAPAVENFMVVREEHTGVVFLSWQYLAPEFINQIEIYRKSGEDNASKYLVLSGISLKQSYESIAENVGNYIWKNPRVQLKSDHAYSVRILMKNGDVTPRTDWLNSNASK